MAERTDGLDGFIRHQGPPLSFDDQVARTRQSQLEWRKAAPLLAAMRARPEQDHPHALIAAIADALVLRDYWAGLLGEKFEVRPPLREPLGRKLTATEVGELATALWSWEYWQSVLLRIGEAMVGAVQRGETWWSAGWAMVCDICENQPVELDGEIVRKGRQLGIGTAVAVATLAGFAAARLSVTTNKRLRGVSAMRCYASFNPLWCLPSVTMSLAGLS